MVPTPLTQPLQLLTARSTGRRSIRAFRLMYLSRCLDDREVMLKRQSKIFFQISCAGHEAIQVAAGMVLQPGSDWAVPYYRDRALALDAWDDSGGYAAAGGGCRPRPEFGRAADAIALVFARLRILTGLRRRAANIFTRSVAPRRRAISRPIRAKLPW